MENMEIDQFSSSSAQEAILNNGLMRTQSAYSTAIQVIKPRNLNSVIQRCLEEAAIAGDEFYYAWKQGGEIIEGTTVGAALAIARNWGNCAVDCKVEETPNAYIFHGAFIDLETGFNLVRPFRQNKQSPKNKKGEDIYKGERGKDIVFQIGASKGIRNAVLNGVPKWLTSKVMVKAKENVAKKIQDMGVEKARALIVKKASALGIVTDRLESVYGRQPSWDVEKLVMLSGAIRSIEDGYESAEVLFPIDEPDETKQPDQPKETVNKSTGEITKDQVETAAVVQEDNPYQAPEIAFDESNPETFENPEYWLYKIHLVAEQLNGDTKKWTAWKKENKSKIDSFGGKDAEAILKALNKAEDALLRGKK